MDDILETVGQIGLISTALATIALVILFWKTITQLEDTVKLVKLLKKYEVFTKRPVL